MWCGFFNHVWNPFVSKSTRNRHNISDWFLNSAFSVLLSVAPSLLKWSSKRLCCIQNLERFDVLLIHCNFSKKNHNKCYFIDNRIQVILWGNGRCIMQYLYVGDNIFMLPHTIYVHETTLKIKWCEILLINKSFQMIVVAHWL